MHTYLVVCIFFCIFATEIADNGVENLIKIAQGIVKHYVRNYY